MSDVTDADRKRAWAALRQANENDGYTLSDDEARVEAIAAALAEERTKARAPFLALAEELEQRDLQRDSGGEVTWLIRQAAGGTE